MACKTSWQFQASTLQGLFEGEQVWETSLGMVGQKQSPLSQVVSREDAHCSHHGVFEQQGLPQDTLVATRAGFGPPGSAQGLRVTPARPQQVHWGPSGLEGVCPLRKGFYLITSEPTCRHSPAQQNR